jgi:uncharacterized membrane protein
VLDLPRSWPKRIALFALAGFFVRAGIGHFTNTDFFLSIMPPYLPAHLELVHLSGAFEILGGIGVLIPAVRGLSGMGLVALLIAVYPANIHMAVHPEAYVAAGTPLWALYARLPLQFVFLAWAYLATRPERRL